MADCDTLATRIHQLKVSVATRNGELGVVGRHAVIE